MLIGATARSSESVLLLAAHGQLWDAELVLRSVFEGTVKLTFLLESEQEFAQRHREYAEDLFQISLLRDDQKARDFLDVVPGSETREWDPIRALVLPDGERDEIRGRYTKEARAALERRWGFTAMVRALGKTRREYEGFAGLARGYSIASHVQHADYSGVAMPLDREMRSPERRDAIHLAHLSRVIIDAVVCVLIRLLAGYRYARLDLRPVEEAAAKMNALQASFGDVYKHWMDVEYGPGDGSAPAARATSS